MIYDCFTYWNEDELLFLRIKHLYDHVDKFVIVESNVTHRGRKKEFNIENILNTELSWAKDKIIYVKKAINVDNLDLSYKGESYNPNSPYWFIENEQRNGILDGLVNSKDDDIIMIGDLDEFPSQYAMLNLNNFLSYSPVISLGMRAFMYYLDVEKPLDHLQHRCWIGTVVGRRSHLKTPQLWRDWRGSFPWEGALGYHFTFIGYDKVIEKYNNTAHDEISSSLDKEHLKKCFVQNDDGLFDDMFKEGIMSHLVDIRSDPNYPLTILNYKWKYEYMFYKK